MTSPPHGRPGPWCRIGSFDELEQHQPAILERIAELPNGGNLFLAHPLLLLEELGVELTEDFQRELLAQEPSLATLSRAPYEALKRSGAPQEVRVRLSGLFRRGGHP
jgi:hypothetical protein